MGSLSGIKIIINLPSAFNTEPLLKYTHTHNNNWRYFLGIADVQFMEGRSNYRNKNWGQVIWPSNYTSKNILKESENTNSIEYVHPYVHNSDIYNGQDLETA